MRLTEWFGSMFFSGCSSVSTVCSKPLLWIQEHRKELKITCSCLVVSNSGGWGKGNGIILNLYSEKKRIVHSNIDRFIVYSVSDDSRGGKSGTFGIIEILIIINIHL